MQTEGWYPSSIEIPLLSAIFFVYENGAGYIFGPVFKKIICEAHNFVLEAVNKYKKYTII